MKILVVGGGGREHAAIKKIISSRGDKPAHTIYCAPGNGGIEADAEVFPDIKATDTDGQVVLADKLDVDLVVIGPDDALPLGLADKLRHIGIPAFGPDAAAARLESSKVFSKDLMKKYNIPTADYEVFDSAEAARAYIEGLKKFPTVIKADGLALGKGVIIAEDKAAALAAVTEIMEDKKFGNSGSKIVVEEFLTGPEISVFVVTDGMDAYELSSAMDHKRAGDNDTGLNTGGMGTIAPNPFYTESIQKETEERIIKPTISAMRSEKCPFVGVIFFGLMATPDGVKVIEYNSRFGDPEAQVILPLFDGEFTKLIYKTATGYLGAHIDYIKKHPEVQQADLNHADLNQADACGTDACQADVQSKDVCSKDVCSTDACSTDACGTDTCSIDACQSEKHAAARHAACVVLASGGYPEKYETGKLISGLNAKGQLDGFPDVTVYHSGTKYTDGNYYTAGGRVLGITAVAETLQKAVDRAYEAAAQIDFEGKYYRTDIGKKALTAN
jgi:phosphoribosylamine--glycine ligase